MWGATHYTNLRLNSSIFQSTLPVWGATRDERLDAAVVRDFNPRSPCGERQRRACVFHAVSIISIHAPRVGSDSNPTAMTAERAEFQSTLPVWGATFMPATSAAAALFQSTLPVWGATIRSVFNRVVSAISIHAPRVGSDIAFALNCKRLLISIHAPRVGSDGI